MGTLDKSKPYAIVYGQPGVAFEQDNKLFNGAGMEVTLVDGVVKIFSVMESPRYSRPGSFEVDSESTTETPDISGPDEPKTPHLDLRSMKKEDIIAELEKIGAMFTSKSSRLTLLKLLQEKIKESNEV